MKRLLALLLVGFLLAAQPSVAGVYVGFGSPQCLVGDILNEAYNSNPGGDSTWSMPVSAIDTGCTANLDGACPSLPGFSGECYAVYVPAENYKQAYMGWNDSTERQTVYVRFYIDIENTGLSVGQQQRILQYGNTALADYFQIFLRNDATYGISLRVAGNTGGLASDYFSISISSKYLFEAKLVNSGSLDSFEWWINGVSQGTQSGNLFSNGFQKMLIGQISDQAVPSALSMYIDNTGVSAYGRLGACE